MTLSEIERRLNNICQVGTISAVQGGLYAKVNISGRTTGFFPVMAQMSAFQKHFIPPKVGEQVLVFCPNGDADHGYILRGIGDSSSSSGDDSTETIEYEDGTKIKIALKDKKITVDTPMDITINSKSFVHP